MQPHIPFDWKSCTMYFNWVAKVIRVSLLLHCFALWLVDKIRTTFSANEKQNPNQSWLPHTHFPALGVGNMLRILIGSLRCLRLLWLVRVVVLFSLLRHSIKNRSIVQCYLNSPNLVWWQTCSHHILQGNVRKSVRIWKQTDTHDKNSKH